MPTKKWPPKDPTDVASYGADWPLGEDTIVTSDWSIPVGLTKITDSVDGNRAIVKLADGLPGVTYDCVNLITTVGGDTFERTVKLPVKQL